MDDNRTNCFVAREILKRLGVQVHIVNNGMESLKEVQKNDYQIVFMDCQMPIMDGFEASIAIRNLRGQKYQSLHIVALTADIQTSTQQKCLSSGMNSYLSKPLSKEKLIMELAKVSPNNSDIELELSSSQLEGFPKFIDQDRILTIIDHDINLESYEFLKMLFQNFVDSSDRYLHNLREYSDNNKFSELNKEIHTLKGLAINLGMIRVLKTLNDFDQAEGSAQMSQQIDLVQEYFTEVNDWYLQYFKSYQKLTLLN